MASYCRKKGIIPNITVSDINNKTAKKLADVMGAVSVSNYNKDICYNSIKMLLKHGLSQVNMHLILAEENYDKCLETLEDIAKNKVPGLNAVIFLSLKKKGRGKNMSILGTKKYRKIISYCLKNEIRFGMDSCGAIKFLDSVKNHQNYSSFSILSESCEASCFSQYVNVDGLFFPCSFCEGNEEWGKGIDVLSSNSYLEDIWYNTRTISFRKKLCHNVKNYHKSRECPIYEV